MGNRYEIDHDWLSPDNASEEGAPATVRLTATGPHARQAVMEWLDDLPADPLGTRGRDRWMVKEVTATPESAVLDITSGGEDIAKGLDEATDEAHAILDALGCELEWEQLPRD